jgi:hypothetical protein
MKAIGATAIIVIVGTTAVAVRFAIPHNSVPGAPPNTAQTSPARTSTPHATPTEDALQATPTANSTFEADDSAELPAGFYPPGTRLGISGPDAIIAAIENRDADFLAGLVVLSTTDCSSTGASGRPPCPMGLADGSRVTAVPYGCRPEYPLTQAGVRELIRRWLSVRRLLYAAFPASRQPFPGASSSQMVLVYGTDLYTAPAWSLFITGDGQIVMMVGCGNPPDEVAGVTDFVLAPNSAPTPSASPSEALLGELQFVASYWHDLIDQSLTGVKTCLECVDVPSVSTALLTIHNECGGKSSPSTLATDPAFDAGTHGQLAQALQAVCSKLDEAMARMGNPTDGTEWRNTAEELRSVLEGSTS